MPIVSVLSIGRDAAFRAFRAAFGAGKSAGGEASSLSLGAGITARAASASEAAASAAVGGAFGGLSTAPMVPPPTTAADLAIHARVLPPFLPNRVLHFLGRGIGA